MVITDWFNVSPTKHTWLSDRIGLVGKEGEVEVIGPILGVSKVDIKFSVFDGDNDINNLMSKVNIKTNGGFQIASTKVRGVIKTITRVL